MFRDGTRISLDITPEAGPAVFGYLPGFDMDHIGRRVQSAMRRIPNWVDADPLVLGMLPPRGRLGIRAQSVSGQLAEYFGVDGGVLVAYVSDGSVASTAGLQAGDSITGVDGEEVDDVADLCRRLADVEPGGSFNVAVTRDGTERSVSATMTDPEEERRARRLQQTI